jgi:hypothetical protein
MEKLFVTLGCALLLFREGAAAGGALASFGNASGAKPDPSDTAGTARWLLSQATWGVISTASVHLGGAAFGNPVSVVDALSDGTPYFYVSMLDASQQDMVVDNRCTLGLSEAEVDCATLQLDPEDPRCVRLSLSGRMVNVTDKVEAAKAKTAIFDAHPAMKSWPSDHSWIIQKLETERIWLIDYFGGAIDVPLHKYAAATPPSGRVAANATRREPHKAKPFFFEKVTTARWLTHQSLWGMLATTSSHLKGYTFANPVSLSDGTTTNSTGTPYFYVSNLDASMQDILINPSCTLTLSEATVDCGANDRDPEDPRCVRMALSGTLQNVTAATAEYDFAKQSLFSAHPAMAQWPASHDFHIVKMQISKIWLIDFFGGADDVSVDEYFKTDPLANDTTRTLVI